VPSSGSLVDLAEIVVQCHENGTDSGFCKSFGVKELIIFRLSHSFIFFWLHFLFFIYTYCYVCKERTAVGVLAQLPAFRISGSAQVQAR
jgi:hypothetical protein